MEEIKKRLNALSVELQDIMGKVNNEIESFESDDEEATSPWEDCSSFLTEAEEAIENSLNSIPAE